VKEIKAAGVLFKRAGKVYDFLSAGAEYKIGDWVIVEAEKGIDIARVVVATRVLTDNRQGMKKILRKASEEDFEKLRSNKGDEEKAYRICQDFVTKHNLQMKLLLAEYSLDRSKLTFYYTADNRVDFRQLVKDLARSYRTRIEMRQIGVRDATKILGGFGVCGRELCCTSFLRKFSNISLKSAKGQNIAMNPSKISGICGRLMCCLVYEKGCQHAATVSTEEGAVAELVVTEDNSAEEGEL
jgi:cell fate regulator YaaT (PSP1 superfamily)